MVGERAHMAWHVASRAAIPTSCLSEPLARPLDLEYEANAHKKNWWQPQQRLGNLSWPTSTNRQSPRQLPPIMQVRRRHCLSRATPHLLLCWLQLLTSAVFHS